MGVEVVRAERDWVGEVLGESCWVIDEVVNSLLARRIKPSVKYNLISLPRPKVSQNCIGEKVTCLNLR